LIAVVMTLSGFMTWKWFHADHADMVVRARSTTAAPETVSTPASPVQSAVETAAPKEVEASPAPATDAIAPTISATAEKPLTETPTNAPAPVEPPKPPPVIYKLQGILFQPGHSTAVVNGKTVSAGEHVGDARVVSIDKETVVLVNSSGETNLLELP
jgi:hypothetical protein